MLLLLNNVPGGGGSPPAAPRTPITWSTWGVSWGQAWGNSWGPIGAPTILYQQQGGGLPKRRRKQHEREKELSESLEQTMRAMLWHPRTVAAVASTVATTREDQRLRRRHEAVHTLLQTRTRLAEEQDEEEWILMA